MSNLTNISTDGDMIKSFVFGIVDYVVFTLMLCISASIGVYFGFFAKVKNTTEEYLMGGHRMRTIPIAISLVASQLSGISIMSVPAEAYAFGFNHIFVVISMVLVAPVLCYVIIPVFYENKISNCYEYLEIRFNKSTRRLITASFILNSFLMLPVIIFVPALAFAQVTGINIHLINSVVCSICVFYTMLGGIKAVVWTDVVQAGIMCSSVVLVGVLGTIKIGGLDKVLEYAEEGGRLDFNFSLDWRVRVTVWNALIGGGLMWTGHIGLNQSCVQRIVSLPSLAHAKRSLYIACVGFIIIMGLNSFIGIIMFAFYHDCDPFKAGLVDKPDKMMPFFVQDIMGHLKGMPGVFISCVFSAALSTMSAILNSLAGVVYFDYIKPIIKEYHTEARANSIMKVFVVIMGVYCVVGGMVVQQFNSILQLIVTITGINTGATLGVFLLGLFVPRIKGRVAFTSAAFSILAMMWVITNAQMRFKSGAMKYSPLPTTTEGCNVMTISHNKTLSNVETTLSPRHDETAKVTTAFESNRDFSLYEISFYWYKALGVIFVWLLAIPLSYLWKDSDDENINLHLYSPFVRHLFRHRLPTKMDDMQLKSKQSNKNDEKLQNNVTNEEKEILIIDKQCKNIKELNV